MDRAVTPWVIGTAHRPAFSSFRTNDIPAVADHLYASLEPVLRRHNVDIMLYGHVHTYERSCALAHGACVGSGPGGDHTTVQLNNGTVHITVGSGGHALEDPKMLTKHKPGSEKVHIDYGFVRLDLKNATHADFSFVEVKLKTHWWSKKVYKVVGEPVDHTSFVRRWAAPLAGLRKKKKPHKIHKVDAKDHTTFRRSATRG